MSKKVEPMFKIGDEVITKYGEKGKIIDICACDECKERGFYEPTVVYQNGEIDYITHCDFVNNFRDYYKIGCEICGNLIDKSELQHEIDEHKGIINELEQQIETVKELQVLKTKMTPILNIERDMEQDNENQETLEVIVDGTQYSFKCGEIDLNGNYFSVARNPSKCPICDKEYTNSEFICAIEHGTIQLRNICVDCYNKIFNK